MRRAAAISFTMAVTRVEEGSVTAADSDRRADAKSMYAFLGGASVYDRTPTAAHTHRSVRGRHVEP